MFIVKDWQNGKLFEDILVNPFQNCNELSIVSGYASAAMVEQQLMQLHKNFGQNDLRINLIVGMAPVSGISEAQHKGFRDFQNRMGGRFTCSYIRPEADPVHSKLYIWKRDGIPQQAFIASANYTVNAFLRRQGEVASICDSLHAEEYFRSLTNDSVYCTHPEAENLIIPEIAIWQNQQIGRLPIEGSKNLFVNNTAAQSVRLPLFSERNGTIQEKSGLNWGQRPEHGREPNQAYIPVPQYIHKEFPDFFPTGGQQFTVLTADGFPFICTVCQQGDKAIESANNSDLGRYFRMRLGVADGSRVDLSDLDRFGNRYVIFHKISDEEYIMDFSPQL